MHIGSSLPSGSASARITWRDCAARLTTGRTGWRMVGLEVAEEDEYRWSLAADPRMRRVHAVPQTELFGASGSMIRRRVVETLDGLQPSAVCINGWAVPEAVAALAWCRAQSAARF